MQISVVIPTYNRCNVLAMVLDRLERQADAPSQFEVIVVDDGSVDGTQEIISRRSSRSLIPVHYLRHENRGPGYTQNRGILAAQAELILILADDILASERLVEHHLEMHAKNPADEVAILGKVVQSDLLPQTVFQRTWDPFRYDKLAGKRELPSFCFFGCNISFKKRFLLEKGLFLERKGAAHEDIELGYRLGDKGLRILYSEDALGFHHHAETFQGACRRAYERGWNFDLLCEHIPKSFIFPLYSILSPEAGAAAFMKMLPREMLRGLFFNRCTVGSFWQPVLEKAETSRLAACLANSFTYRGAVNHYLRVGYWDKKSNRSKNSPY